MLSMVLKYLATLECPLWDLKSWTYVTWLRGDPVILWEASKSFFSSIGQVPSKESSNPPIQEWRPMSLVVCSGCPERRQHLSILCTSLHNIPVFSKESYPYSHLYLLFPSPKLLWSKFPRKYIHQGIFPRWRWQKVSNYSLFGLSTQHQFLASPFILSSGIACGSKFLVLTTNQPLQAGFQLCGHLAFSFLSSANSIPIYPLLSIFQKFIDTLHPPSLIAHFICPYIYTFLYVTYHFG